MYDYFKQFDTPYKLSKRTVTLIVKHGIKKVIDKIKKADRKILLAAQASEKELTEDRRKCTVCKTSLKENGFVCSRHYHDYEDCGRNDCLWCILIRSGYDEIREELKNVKTDG